MKLYVCSSSLFVFSLFPAFLSLAYCFGVRWAYALFSTVYVVMGNAPFSLCKPFLIIKKIFDVFLKYRYGGESQQISNYCQLLINLRYGTVFRWDPCLLLPVSYELNWSHSLCYHVRNWNLLVARCTLYQACEFGRLNSDFWALKDPLETIKVEVVVKFQLGIPRRKPFLYSCSAFFFTCFRKVNWMFSRCKLLTLT